MPDHRLAERRLMLEAIVSDPGASHSDRLRADERLAELDARTRASVAMVEQLSPEDALAEAESLAGALPGIVACAKAAMGVLPDEAIEAPDDPSELREVIGLQEQVIATLEATLLDREVSLQRVMVQRALLPAPEPVTVSDG